MRCPADVTLFYVAVYFPWIPGLPGFSVLLWIPVRTLDSQRSWVAIARLDRPVLLEGDNSQTSALHPTPPEFGFRVYGPVHQGSRSHDSSSCSRHDSVRKYMIADVTVRGTDVRGVKAFSYIPRSLGL